MPTRKINGADYHYDVVGDGKPLLLLHGFTGASENWQPLVPHFGSNRQLIMVDILGHGLSEAPEHAPRYEMSQIAQDVRALLDQLAARPFDLLGYSMGGRLGLYLAVHFPDAFDRVVIESASPGLAAEKARTDRRQRDEALADRIEAEGIPAFVDFWENLGLWHSQSSLPEEVKVRQREQRLRNRPVGLANSLRGMGTGAQPSLWSRLGSVNRPVLLINGELDTKYVTINAQMASQFPNCQTITIAGVGHNAHLEKPEIFCQIVREFLDSVSAK